MNSDIVRKTAAPVLQAVGIAVTPEIQGNGFTFGIAPKVTKSLGPKPPKAEKPDSIPKIRKLAALKQTDFLTAYCPAFLLRNAFPAMAAGFPGIEDTLPLLKPAFDLGFPAIFKPFSLSKL